MPMSFRLSSIRFRMPSRSAMTALCSATALASGAMVAAAAAGCKASDSVPDDAGTFEGGAGAASNDCTTCAAQECTGVWAVCLTDERCVALRACNNAFGESDGARAQCFCDGADASAATADGGAEPLAAYAAFAACSDARTCGACASDCTSACTNGAPNTKTTVASCGGAVADASVTDAASAADADAGDAGAADADADAGLVTPVTASVDACASCASDKCGDAKKACALGTECSLFLACAHACTDASCVAGCGDAHSTGRASAMELSSCTLTSCRSACGL
jgi:hypothetical protein